MPLAALPSRNSHHGIAYRARSAFSTSKQMRLAVELIEFSDPSTASHHACTRPTGFFARTAYPKERANRTQGAPGSVSFRWHAAALELSCWNLEARKKWCTAEPCHSLTQTRVHSWPGHVISVDEGHSDLLPSTRKLSLLICKEGMRPADQCS